VTRDEIYDHLAQVYLGKRKEADIKKKRQFNAWLVINICITGVIFSSVFYGLTAFLTQQKSILQSNIIFSLHNGPIQIAYNFNNDFPPVKSFSLKIPSIDVGKYQKLQFSIRAREEGTPGIVKIEFENRRHEKSSYYIRNVDLSWQEVAISLEEFQQITDWNSLKSVSFILESWNADKKKGVVLIDDVRFSS